LGFTSVVANWINAKDLHSSACKITAEKSITKNLYSDEMMHKPPIVVFKSQSLSR